LDFDLTEEQRMFRDEVIRFARAELNEDVAARDAQSSFAEKEWQKCAKLGGRKVRFCSSVPNSTIGLAGPHLRVEECFDRLPEPLALDRVVERFVALSSSRSARANLDLTYDSRTRQGEQDRIAGGLNASDLRRSLRRAR
jgi:hypothetical protein